jgi:tetratricopeptide (TPR) repeat protein
MTYPEAVRALATGAFIPAITTLHGHLSDQQADGHAWMYLGIAYSETGHQAEALRALERARLIIDESAELDEAFGCTFLRMGEHEIAGTYFESATRYANCPASHPDLIPINSTDSFLGLAPRDKCVRLPPQSFPQQPDFARSVSTARPAILTPR